MCVCVCIQQRQLLNWWVEADTNRHTSQLLREHIYELQNSKMLENKRLQQQQQEYADYVLCCELYPMHICLVLFT